MNEAQAPLTLASCPPSLCHSDLHEESISSPLLDFPGEEPVSWALHVQKPVGSPWVPCPSLCTRQGQIILTKSSHDVEWGQLGFSPSLTTHWLRGLVLMLFRMPEFLHRKTVSR